MKILKNRFKKKFYRIIINLIFLFVISLNLSCNQKNSPFYIKARSSDEVKIGAFEICGRDYRIISFEEDTAIINCKK